MPKTIERLKVFSFYNILTNFQISAYKFKKFLLCFFFLGGGGGGGKV